MAGFNISMEQINNDYSRVVSISEENETFKSELYNLYESQKGIREDLRLANEDLDYARKECKQAKKSYKNGKISEDKYSEYGEEVKECKDLIRTLTDIKRKNGEAIKNLRSAIKSNKELLSARVDARYDWET
jgi:hypothetical protein